MVLVVINSLSFEFFNLSSAGSEKTPWVTYAEADFAPADINASAALVSVPAVSTISSMRIQSLFFTSPIIFYTSETLAFSLLLSTIAKFMSSLLAIYLALTTPPTSGEVIMVFSREKFFFNIIY